jgi:hypothetical protein
LPSLCLLLCTGRTRQDDYKYYDYPLMSDTLALLKSKNIKFVGICQPGCDATQMWYLVSPIAVTQYVFQSKSTMLQPHEPRQATSRGVHGVAPP